MSYLGQPTPQILGVDVGNPLIRQMDVHDAATIASKSHLLNKIRSCITRVSSSGILSVFSASPASNESRKTTIESIATSSRTIMFSAMFQSAL